MRSLRRLGLSAAVPATLSLVSMFLFTSLISSSFISGPFLNEASAKEASKKSQGKAESKVKGGQVEFKVGTKGDEYFFNPTKLTAKAGQTVKVIFTNGASAESGLEHNFVLVKPGKAEEVANAGIQAGAEKNWVPDGSADVIAHTKLVKPQQSETLTFQAPAQPGSYPYLCTFPGHSATMQGVLVVTK